MQGKLAPCQPRVAPVQRHAPCARPSGLLPHAGCPHATGQPSRAGGVTYSRDHRTARSTAPRVSRMPVIRASADRLRRLPASAAQKATNARAAAPRRPSRRARHRPIRSRTSPHDGAPLPRRPSLFVQGRARESPRGLLVLAVPLGAVLPRVHEARGHLRHDLSLLGTRVRDDAVIKRDAHLRSHPPTRARACGCYA